MTATTTWGGTTIASPSEFSSKEETIGSEVVMEDGTLKKEVIARKWRYTVKWQRLTAAQVVTLYAAYIANLTTAGGATFVLPDTTSKSVLPVGGGWEQVPYWYQSEDIFRYDVTLTLREV